MIKYCDIIEENQTRIGNLRVVRMRIRYALRPAGHTVAEEADCAAKKWRQVFLVVHAQRTQLFFQEPGRIGSRAIEAERAARIESNERIAAEVLAALDGLEEKSVSAFARERRKRDDRRERVCAQLPNDGDDVVLVSQRVEIHRKASRNSAFCRIACAWSS